MSKYTTYGNSFSSFKGILDLFPNAQAGFSVRKLRAGYNGYCMRVSKTASLDFIDVGFVNNELDTASITSFLGTDDGFVTIFYNQAIGGVNAISTQSARRPKIAFAGVINKKNGKPSLRFNGDLLHSNGLGTSDTRSNFIVGSLDGSYLGSYHTFYISTKDAVVNGNFQHLYADATNYVSNYPTNTLDNNIATINLNQRLLNQIKTPLASKTSIDNSSLVSKTDVQNLEDFLRIGTYGSNYLNGNIQELIIFSDDKSLDQTAINTNINDYFSVY